MNYYKLAETLIDVLLKDARFQIDLNNYTLNS
jgi:hypothetical protein